jgi:putative ABC transport system ATP-binding protein
MEKADLGSLESELSHPLVKLSDVTLCYEQGRIVALDGINFAIAPAEAIAVVGPSGCGKTSLAMILAGLLRPDRGWLLIEGKELTNEAELRSYRSQVAGVVFQEFYLLPTLTAFENIELPMIGTPLAEERRVARVNELLARVGLAARANHFPAQLSGGERQRVALCRAIANRPRFLIADEPTGQLDSRNGADVIDLMFDLQREFHTSLVVITHNPSVAERCGRLIQMRDGRFIE